ncbi:hypothetical protein BDN70DRAFT_852095 [Pholiota conissans]|uniref:Protein kinase domain-containing protein n=1 Tax=Pholiota conissans TaxID=109636 RepID=A0A9P5ZC47_9AGAR|nr:hypothetical protein BDN70DRAFT_852095 [Pholiota conissans]
MKSEQNDGPVPGPSSSPQKVKSESSYGDIAGKMEVDTPSPKAEPGTAPEVLMETIVDTQEESSSTSEAKAFLKFVDTAKRERDVESDSESEQDNRRPQDQEREFFEDLILSRHSAVPIKIDMATATDKEKAIERARRLNHPNTQHRFVFQQWPRDPKGDWIKQDGAERRGKEAPNGSNIWGATLFDLYTVHRSPDCPGLITLSSGSRIAAWMKEHGETYASACLQAAEEEEEPHLILPTDIARLIKDGERMVCHKATWHPVQPKKNKKGKTKVYEAWELPANWPPKSPFNHTAYPYPWPYKPFDRKNFWIRYPTLAQYITPSRLPAKLVVHDPGRLLHADPEVHEDVDPDSPDITHIYTLQRSTTNNEREKNDEAELRKMEADRKRIREEFLKDPHSNRPMPSGVLVERETINRVGPCMPPVYVVFPHQTERPQMKEAHLYLTPSYALGQGSHSYVYRVEFELPRNFLIDEEMCMKCVLMDMQDIIAEQDKNGRDPKWSMPIGRRVLKQKRKIGITAVLEKDGKEKEYLARAPALESEVVYEGPYRVIESRIHYQDLSLGPYCEHIRKDFIHPLTSKVYVAAKLSIDGDPHLAREAENYQAFPRHFFEHWSGYNIVYPLKDPVPVAPLVPQYYGYYTVDRNAKQPKPKKPKVKTEEDMDVDSEDKGKGKEKATDTEDTTDTADETSKPKMPEYLSPILLLEDCGRMIDPGLLSIDDKNECAALIHRFHEAGWLHNSVAKRNIVRQSGPLSSWPLERMINAGKRDGLGENWSYRLIDFGRSCKEEDNPGLMQGERLIIDNWLFGLNDL